MEIQSQDSVLVNDSTPVSRIWINRVDYVNTINADVLRGLVNALERIRLRAPRVVIIGSTCEGAFAAGLDVRSVMDLGEGAWKEFVESGRKTLNTIESFPCPVIASVNSVALGVGLEIALACDLIVASEAARFGMTDINFGLIPALGGIERLSSRCGKGRARRLMFSGEMIPADEAFAIGLVDRVAPEGALSETSSALADEIATRSPLCVTSIKKHVLDSPEGSESIVQDAVDIFNSEDRLEGMQAFIQKRVPVFKGR